MTVWLALAERDRRAIVGGAVVLGACGLWPALRLVTAWQNAKMELLQSLGDRETTDRQTAGSPNRIALREWADRDVIAGRSVEGMLADLTVRIAALADSARVQATTIEPGARSSARGASTVRTMSSHASIAVRLIANTDIAGLSRLLRTIDADAHHLVVRNLAVTARNGDRAQMPNPLHIEVTIETIGLIRPVAR